MNFKTILTATILTFITSISVAEAATKPRIKGVTIHDETDDFLGTSKRLISWSGMRTFGVPSAFENVSYTATIDLDSGEIEDEGLFIHYYWSTDVSNPKETPAEFVTKQGNVSVTAIKIDHAKCSQYGCNSVYFGEIEGGLETLNELISEGKKTKFRIYHKGKKVNYAGTHSFKNKELLKLIEHMNTYRD